MDPTVTGILLQGHPREGRKQPDEQRNCWSAVASESKAMSCAALSGDAELLWQLAEAGQLHGDEMLCCGDRPPELGALQL